MKKMNRFRYEKYRSQDENARTDDAGYASPAMTRWRVAYGRH